MFRPGHGIRLRSSARTNKGRVRQNNEDRVHLWGDTSFVLAVVADGMGGAAAGEEASRIAVETIHELLVNNGHQKPEDYGNVDTFDLHDKLEAAVKEANNNILSKAILRPEFKGMGTTITMAFARHADVILAHVGDSRAYMIDGDDGHIAQITADHSFVQALVDAGHITKEEAEEHPMKNVLYRALGQASDVDIDMIEDVHLHVGDRLVLCSDGLTLHVKPPEIAELALADGDPNVISQKLIELANSRGGKDNISVIVIVVEADPINLSTDMEEFEMSYEDDEPTLPMNNPASVPASLPPTDAPPSTPTLGLQVYSGRTSAAYGEGRDRFNREG